MAPESPQRRNARNEPGAPDVGASAPGSKPGGTELYSGTPLTPETFKRFMRDPAMAAARSLRNSLRGSAARITFSTFFDSNRGAPRRQPPGKGVVLPLSDMMVDGSFV